MHWEHDKMIFPEIELAQSLTILHRLSYDTGPEQHYAESMTSAACSSYCVYSLPMTAYNCPLSFLQAILILQRVTLYMLSEQDPHSLLVNLVARDVNTPLSLGNSLAPVPCLCISFTAIIRYLCTVYDVLRIVCSLC